eukprot:CCRYP_017971-RB/>CCRYP_017971-RB protein AED:0.01 eAED:0.01 QI:70/-1/1/1/-1/1/1/532/337
MPLPVSLLAAALVASIGVLFATTQHHRITEDNLRHSGLLIFQPDKFQGAKKTHRYFEGWYYKFVTSNDNAEFFGIDANLSLNGDFSMAVVPGIFLGNATNSAESHAFVFVTLNGQRQHYYRFSLDEFSYANSRDEIYIQVGDNRFSHQGVSLNLYPREDDADLVLRGNLTFYNTSSWPVSLFQLGAMGPVGWMPGLECTHGVLSFDHEIHGYLTVSSTREATDPKTISMDRGRGYTEKDYGRSFPSTWVWIQTNSFRNNPGTSLFVSIARIPTPLFRWEFPGFTAAIWHNGRLIPFATWSGAKFEELRVSEDEVYIVMRSSRRISSRKRWSLIIASR